MLIDPMGISPQSGYCSLRVLGLPKPFDLVEHPWSSDTAAFDRSSRSVSRRSMSSYAAASSAEGHIHEGNFR